jgi:hypothetical protein
MGHESHFRTGLLGEVACVLVPEGRAWRRSRHEAMVARLNRPDAGLEALGAVAWSPTRSPRPASSSDGVGSSSSSMGLAIPLFGASIVWDSDRVHPAAPRPPTAIAEAARAALERGHGIRPGLEDITRLPDGREARDNAELVAAAVRLIGAHGQST